LVLHPGGADRTGRSPIIAAAFPAKTGGAMRESQSIVFFSPPGTE